jgi:RNA polymerase sigma-70 factor (ECF subfamily)
VAGRFLKDPTERQEAVREAFEIAFRGLEMHAPPAPLDAWLRRLTVQACAATLRTRARREADITPLLPRFDETGHRLVGNAPAAWPSRAFSDTADNRAHARACLDRLPERYRAPLLLTDVEGYDADETARLLGLTPGNIGAAAGIEPGVPRDRTDHAAPFPGALARRLATEAPAPRGAWPHAPTRRKHP